MSVRNVTRSLLSNSISKNRSISYFSNYSNTTTYNSRLNSFHQSRAMSSSTKNITIDDIDKVMPKLTTFNSSEVEIVEDSDNNQDHTIISESDLNDDPIIQDIYHDLHQNSPGFVLNQSDVHIIPTPNGFYEGILDIIRTSKKRIVLSALYIGTGQKEQKFFSALDSQLTSEAGLNVHLIFDGSRGCRIESTGQSSLDLCLNLMEKHGSRVTTCFLKAPMKTPLANPKNQHPTKYSLSSDNTSQHSLNSKLSSISSSFLIGASFFDRVGHSLTNTIQSFFTGRLSELCAVQHAKMYLGDDRVILTGANAGGVYFEQRQDRYVEVVNSSLCNWLVAYAQTIAVNPFSTLYQGKEGVVLNKNEKGHVDISDAQKLIADRLPEEWYTNPSLSPAARVVELNSSNSGVNGENADISSNTTVTDSNVQFYDSQLLLNHQALLKEQANTKYSTSISSLSSSNETLTIPTPFNKLSTNNLKNRLNSFISLFHSLVVPIDVSPLLTNDKVVIFPFVQWASLGVGHDANQIETLFKNFGAKTTKNAISSQNSENSKISQSSTVSNSSTSSNEVDHIRVHMATGYFNPPTRLYETLSDLLTAPRSFTRVITGSISSNGWGDAKGVTSTIPKLYAIVIYRAISHITNQVYRIRQKLGFKDNNVPFVVEEYLREHWSYHAKGLWVQYGYNSDPRDSESNTVVDSGVTKIKRVEDNLGIISDRGLFTIIGSSNYGIRSYYRDTELQFYMLVPPASNTVSNTNTVTENNLETDSNSTVDVDVEVLHNQAMSVVTDTSQPLVTRMQAELNLSTLHSRPPQGEEPKTWGKLLLGVAKRFM